MLVANLYRLDADVLDASFATAAHRFRIQQLTVVAALRSNIDGEDRKERAVKALHHHTLSSYEKWATNMQKMKISDAYGRRGDADTSTRLYEVVLWWCIWGEAANMRFTPEFLSWVFWSLVQNRYSSETYFGRYDNGEGFLRHVMRPMYTYVSKQAFQKDMAGNNCDHLHKKNIDDINEYFWRRGGANGCVKFNACCEEPAAGAGELSTSRDQTKSCKGMPELITQLGKEKKTYVERRGWLHSVKSNLRVFTVYICLFHLVVAVAHLVPFDQSTLPLCPPQTPVDACYGVDDENVCERIQSCDWEKNQSTCYDNCQLCPEVKQQNRTVCGDMPVPKGYSGPVISPNQSTCKRTLGCKWVPDDNDSGTCRMFNSKSEKELLDSIDHTTFISCDMGTGVCRYRDTKNVLVEYSCLQRLNATEQKIYKDLDQGKWWELYWVTGK